MYAAPNIIGLVRMYEICNTHYGYDKRTSIVMRLHGKAWAAMVGG